MLIFIQEPEPLKLSIKLNPLDVDETSDVETVEANEAQDDQWNLYALERGTIDSIVKRRYPARKWVYDGALEAELTIRISAHDFISSIESLRDVRKIQYLSRTAYDSNKFSNSTEFIKELNRRGFYVKYKQMWNLWVDGLYTSYCKVIKSKKRADAQMKAREEIEIEFNKVSDNLIENYVKQIGKAYSESYYTNKMELSDIFRVHRSESNFIAYNRDILLSILDKIKRRGIGQDMEEYKQFVNWLVANKRRIRAKRKKKPLLTIPWEKAEYE